MKSDWDIQNVSKCIKKDGKYTFNSLILLAPLYEQHEVSQKRASMSSRKRALEFFSRGRPTRRLFAPARVFVRTLPHGCMREKAKDLLGDFQEVVGGWPSSSPGNLSLLGPLDFPSASLKKSGASDRPLPRFLVAGIEA